MAETRPGYPVEELSLASVGIVGAISAGGLVEAWQEDLGTIEIPSAWLREAPDAFALRVAGNSLSADGIYDGIYDGMTVILDPSPAFVDGKIYAVRMDGGEVAARRIFSVGRQLKLVSGDGQIDDFPRSRVNIIGRVRWSLREH